MVSDVTAVIASFIQITCHFFFLECNTDVTFKHVSFQNKVLFVYCANVNAASKLQLVDDAVS